MTTKNIPEELQKLLGLWNEGLMTQSEFEGKVYELFFNPLEWAEKGQEVFSFGSCCCSSHPPDRTFKVQVTLQPHGYTIKKVQDE